MGRSRPRSGLASAQLVLADFLYFGYLPSQERAKEAGEWYRQLVLDEDVPTFDDEDLTSVRELLQDVVRSALGKVAGENVTLGLSSGYDSRTLLGGLTDVLPRERIHCFTSGHPGNADFDLAPLYSAGKVAHHEMVNLGGSIRPDIAGMERRARSSPSTMPRALGVPRQTLTFSNKEIFQYPRLHGYLGGIASGSRLKWGVHDDFEEAKHTFVASAARFVKARHQERFFPRDYRPDRHLPDRPFLDPDVLGFDDQLDLLYRQDQLTRTLSSQQYLDAELAEMSEGEARRFGQKRDRILVPFADPRWLRSFLLTPLEQRVEQRTLLRFAREVYPDIFPDLVDPGDPRYHAQKRGNVNSAWEHLWLEDEAFRQLIWAVLSSLRRRDIWFDPFDAIEIADAQASSFAPLLQGLCSLEINIRVGKLPDPGAAQR